MNNRERAALETIYLALAVPYPAGVSAGSQSASIDGFVGFARDMHEVLGPARMAMRLLATGESYEGELDEILAKLKPKQ